MSNESDDPLLDEIRATGAAINAARESGDAADWQDAEDKAAKLKENHG
ncbi:hypothetical protein [Streptomyces cacaoi]|nr:hypothetical protein [Streptomyces cacaoi]